jgi:hypothetical protein
MNSVESSHLPLHLGDLLVEPGLIEAYRLELLVVSGRQLFTAGRHIQGDPDVDGLRCWSVGILGVDANVQGTVFCRQWQT